jgi:glucose-1-phosphate cytidylyltransferase
MKVVIFCGGLGVRMREVSEEIPKTMLRIGDRPILWHIMKYYAYYGFRDFILCLGYRAIAVKNYFLSFSELAANNFVISQGGKDIRHLPSEIDGWNITLVDTGLHTNIGQRLKKVQPFLEGDEMFLANYGDNLTDAPLDEMVQDMQGDPAKIAAFLCVPPSHSFHVVSCLGTGSKCSVSRIETAKESNIWINGGYFVLRREIFDYLKGGTELVPDALNALRESDQLVAWRHEGFWASMDTPKEMYFLNELYSNGRAQWAKWDNQV